MANTWTYLPCPLLSIIKCDNVRAVFSHLYSTSFQLFPSLSNLVDLTACTRLLECFSIPYQIAMSCRIAYCSILSDLIAENILQQTYFWETCILIRNDIKWTCGKYLPNMGIRRTCLLVIVVYIQGSHPIVYYNAQRHFSWTRYRVMRPHDVL